MKEQKGVIAIPTTERNIFAFPFVKSLLSLKGKTGLPVVFSNIGAIDIARNQLLQACLKNECDYIVMIDSDMTFPADAIDRLLETMKKFDAHIGTGLYFKGDEPHDPVVFDYSETDGRYHPITGWNVPRLVDGCGMGFCIIKSDLFGVNFAFTTKDTPSGNKTLLGEDITFCRRAQLKGYKIVLDPSIKCGHIRAIEIDEDYINKL